MKLLSGDLPRAAKALLIYAAAIATTSISLSS